MKLFKKLAAAALAAVLALSMVGCGKAEVGAAYKTELTNMLKDSVYGTEATVENTTELDNAAQVLLANAQTEYDKLTEEYVKRYHEGRGFNFFHFMVDLDQGPCAIKRLSGCGAGHEYLAVAPNGDIYPCHQFVGNKDFLMGNVNENKIDENIEKMFERSNVYTKEKCKNCFAKFYCSGGCSANAYNFNGDINKPYELACEFEKKRLECSIAIEAHKKLS